MKLMTLVTHFIFLFYFIYLFNFFVLPGCLHPLPPPPVPDGKSAGQKDGKRKKNQ